MQLGDRKAERGYSQYPKPFGSAQLIFPGRRKTREEGRMGGEERKKDGDTVAAVPNTPPPHRPPLPLQPSSNPRHAGSEALAL
ncbi:hypothetical protein VZT92_008528 [Zoarces viviparus]|uniref:Uncharacterized protein n=1 Tax=Zoarces viviparus TaxID=48416 RepID=A0AAW1FIF5_ZOAVI